MKRGSGLKRGGPLKAKARMVRASRIKPKKRKPSEFARIYGSRARVRWIKASPCVVCGRGPCENAHTATGGMGRKAGADTIVPLCPQHHRELHATGRWSFQSLHNIDLGTCARAIDMLWWSLFEKRAFQPKEAA